MVFNYLETVKVPNRDFNHLLVGQFNMRPGFEAKIDREIALAKAGKPAKMWLKMNSLQDPEMIQKLYEASQAGVEIYLNIRGICSLIPQLLGWSDNIRAVSIVDRYLEHSRVYIFHNEGANEIYLSSADWMTRNLSYRVETAFPIYDPEIRQQIQDFMTIQMADNVKARILDADMSNQYRRGGDPMARRAQVDVYYYLKRLEEQYLQGDEEEAIV